MAAIKINNELERIGDQATNIASIVLTTPNAVQLANQIDIHRISQAVYTMVKSSLDAFINNDPELAAHILPSDVNVDHLYDLLRGELIDAMKEDVALVSDGANLLLGLYDLERMADHATNIAENVIFLTEAKLVRHRAVNEESASNGAPAPDRDSD